MAKKTVREIRKQMTEVQGPDPEPFSRSGPNNQSIREAHVPARPPMLGKRTLGALPSRKGAADRRSNQNRFGGSAYNLETSNNRKIAEEIVKKVLERGKTATGQPADPIDTEPKKTELVGQLR